MWVFIYQVNGGISLTYFLVEGTKFVQHLRRPTIPPNARSGAVINVCISNITTMVPKGKAAVDPYDIATVVRIDRTSKNGPIKRIPVRRTLLSCNINLFSLGKKIQYTLQL